MRNLWQKQATAKYYNHISHNEGEGLFSWGTLGQGGHSPHVRKELLEPLLPVHRPELELGCSVARIAQAVMEGPVLVEHQTEAGPAVKEAAP